MSIIPLRLQIYRCGYENPEVFFQRTPAYTPEQIKKTGIFVSNTSFSICIVDDDPAICSLLNDAFCKYGYAVKTCSSAGSALLMMQSQPFDMVIADINMPGMNGFELLETVSSRFPATKRVLMTGQDIDDYLPMIRKTGIGTIFAKTGIGHISEILRLVQGLLTGDIFGLERIFPAQEVNHFNIQSSAEARNVCSRIVSTYQGPDRTFIEMALNELITNAVFHAILGLSNVSREHWHDEYDLGARQPVRISWTRNSEQLGISVEDPKGELHKNDVLQWFDHSSKDETVNDNEHGRGLLLIRKLIDRFIINIDPGKRTECILIHFENRSLASKAKSIIINEL